MNAETSTCTTLIWYGYDDATMRRMRKHWRRIDRMYARRKLWERSRYCTYCRCSLRWQESTIDHVLPRSKGGPDSTENFVLACVRCNALKSNRTPREWLERLEAWVANVREVAQRFEPSVGVVAAEGGAL